MIQTNSEENVADKSEREIVLYFHQTLEQGLQKYFSNFANSYGTFISDVSVRHDDFLLQNSIFDHPLCPCGLPKFTRRVERREDRLMQMFCCPLAYALYFPDFITGFVYFILFLLTSSECNNKDYSHCENFKSTRDFVGIASFVFLLIRLFFWIHKLVEFLSHKIVYTDSNRS